MKTIYDVEQRIFGYLSKNSSTNNQKLIRQTLRDERFRSDDLKGKHYKFNRAEFERAVKLIEKNLP